MAEDSFDSLEYLNVDYGGDPRIPPLLEKHGITLNDVAIYLNNIEYELKIQVNRMARRCKEGNLKRLTPELFWVALGRVNNGSI